MDNTGLSASDVALMSRNDGYGDFGGAFWIFALLILAGGGFGGWGNNALGYENLATSAEVQRGFDNQNTMDMTRDILAQVTGGTAQAVAATNQAKYDNIMVSKDIQNELDREISELQVGQANNLAKLNECCCNTLRAIDGVNYNNALNTASINANTTEQTQKVLDAIQANRMADMQNEIDSLKLSNQLANVVRYPNAWTYDAGVSPFCTCSRATATTPTG